MAINVAGVVIGVPSGPVQVPDYSGTVAGLGGNIANMPAAARAGLDAARGTLANIAGPLREVMEREAMFLAVQYDQNGGDNFNDCVPIVAAGMAYFGATKGGSYGAAVGAGGGIYAGRIACRLVFPNQPDPAGDSQGVQQAASDTPDWVIIRLWNQTTQVVPFLLDVPLLAPFPMALNPGAKWWYHARATQAFWTAAQTEDARIKVAGQWHHVALNIVSRNLQPLWETPSSVTGRIDYNRIRFNDPTETFVVEEVKSV